MADCVPQAIDEGREQDQAAAMCNQMWEDRKKSMDNTDTLVWHGGEVKTLGDGKVAGYLVRFSTADDLDLEGEYFDAATDFGSATDSVYPGSQRDR